MMMIQDYPDITMKMTKLIITVVGVPFKKSKKKKKSQKLHVVVQVT